MHHWNAEMYSRNDYLSVILKSAGKYNIQNSKFLLYSNGKFSTINYSHKILNETKHWIHF